MTKAIVAALFLPTLLAQPLELHGEKDADKPKLELRISAPQRNLYENRSVPITFQLVNVSKDEVVYVGRQFSFATDHPSYLTLEVTGGSPAPLTDTMMEWLAPSYARQWWIPLEPGHILASEILIDSSFSGQLAKAGKYELRARYISRGGQTLAKPLEGVSAAQVWKGEIRSNTISIELLPKAKPVGN